MQDGAPRDNWEQKGFQLPKFKTCTPKTSMELIFLTKDSAKHFTSLCTLDRVVHSCRITVSCLAEDWTVPEWDIHTKKNNGRKKFQAHLVIALKDRGIGMDQKEPFDDSKKPAWMPGSGKGTRLRPCDCEKCFFCINKKTGTVSDGKEKVSANKREWGKVVKQSAAQEKIAFCA